MRVITANEIRTGVNTVGMDLHHVAGRPIAPSGLQIVSYSHDTVSLSWTVPDTEGVPILSFRIEKKEVSALLIDQGSSQLS